jgi:hypothetical protein
MEDSKCFCLKSIWAALGDLRQAIERMEREISDPYVRQWMGGYRDGVNAVGERFRITQGKCCCERLSLRGDEK